MEQASILITGAAQRVGLYCAKQLKQAGYSVIITYRSEHDSLTELREMGIVCIECDLLQPHAINHLFDELKTHTKSLRAVIHNASQWLVDQADKMRENMQTMMELHVTIPYEINMGIQEFMPSQDTADYDIIHLTDYVVEKGSTHHIAYAASKAALSNMTKSFAKKLAPQIKVNEIAPSLLMFHDDDSAEYRQQTLDKSVLKIEPGPHEVFNAIHMILNSQYMTGRTIALDGGRHVR